MLNSSLRRQESVHYTREIVQTTERRSPRPTFFPVYEINSTAFYAGVFSRTFLSSVKMETICDHHCGSRQLKHTADICTTRNKIKVLLEIACMGLPRPSFLDLMARLM